MELDVGHGGADDEQRVALLEGLLRGPTADQADRPGYVESPRLGSEPDFTIHTAPQLCREPVGVAGHCGLR